ncbi:MAG TPA: ATP-grasp domain-containing protein [Pirellulaceae bacterium]|nr:ATP-grasp domain-containing protein [Pirellulaceae bacterium]
MKVLIYEFVAGGGAFACNMTPEGPLLDEGRAMVEAVARDWAALPGAEVDLAWDSRLEPDRTLNVRFRFIDSEQEERDLLDSSGEYDVTIVIAPELAHALLERVQWVEQAGGALLCPGSATVSVGADKLATEAVLRSAGDNGSGRVCMIPSIPWDEFCKFEGSYRGNWVVKPRDGVGGERVICVGSVKQACEIVTPDIRSTYLVQPYVPGKPASVAALGGPTPVILPPSAQSIVWKKGAPLYGGGEILTDPDEIQMAHDAMRFALAKLPPFVGYLGVDLILTPDGPRIVEVNPRMTTSYVGARAAIDESLADLTLRVARGEAIPSPRVTRCVRYDTRGGVEPMN